VRGKLSASLAEPFVVEGDNWFPLPAAKKLSWSDIQIVLDTEQRRLADAIAGILERKTQPSLKDGECFDILLGIRCHAVCHAGQIQLIKKLRPAAL